MPRTGTLLLDYPVVVTAQTNDEVYSNAGKALRSGTDLQLGRTARDDAGFRDPLTSELGEGRGVGAITQAHRTVRGGRSTRRC